MKTKCLFVEMFIDNFGKLKGRPGTHADLFDGIRKYGKGKELQRETTDRISELVPASIIL
jgi:hypothetical protein